jgi:hypothetical protein
MHDTRGKDDIWEEARCSAQPVEALVGPAKSDDGVSGVGANFASRDLYVEEVHFDERIEYEGNAIVIVHTI